MHHCLACDAIDAAETRIEVEFVDDMHDRPLVRTEGTVLSCRLCGSGDCEDVAPCERCKLLPAEPGMDLCAVCGDAFDFELCRSPAAGVI